MSILDAKTGAVALAQHLLQSGVNPAPSILEMWQEHFSHQSERRGCGYTQSTRWLSDLINRERSEQDLRDLGGGDPRLWHEALTNFDPLTEGQGVLRALLLLQLDQLVLCFALFGAGQCLQARLVLHLFFGQLFGLRLGSLGGLLNGRLNGRLHGL